MASKKKSNIGGWFLVGLILVGLVGFGTGGLTGNIRNIGTVGDKDVSVDAYRQALNEQLRALSAQFGTQVSFQQAQAFGVDQAALSQLVLIRTLDNEAAQLELSVGDQQVFERLRNISAFQGAGGFNPDTYRFVLEQSGVSEVEYEQNIREELSRNLLQAAIVSGLPEAEIYADTLVQYVSERRNVTWAEVTPSALSAPVPEPTEDDLRAFYDANPERFTLPEAREITFAWLTPDMVLDQMVVPEEAITRLYDERLSQYVVPERALVERLVYIDQGRAELAKSRLDSAEVTFEDLVTERGLTLADIDLGDVSQDELGRAGGAVFAAEVGTVVGPLNTSLGPTLFRVNAKLAEQVTSFDEVAEELRDELAADAARDYIDDSAEPIVDLLAGGATMEDLAERTDMTLGQISWTPDTSDGIAAYDAFREAAATVEQGAFAELLNLSDGGVFTLRLDTITPPTLQDFDAVRSEVLAGWLAQAEKDAIVAVANDLAAQILPLTGFETLGLNATIETELTRRSFVAGTPFGFNDEIFAMENGEVRVLPTDEGAIIVRLDGIAPPDLADEGVAAQREAIAANAASGIAQDIFDAYTTALRQQTEININQATVDAVNAQFR